MVKKSVGIITFHYSENKNFGATLQTCAISKIIEKEGKEYKLINLHPYEQQNLKSQILFKIIRKGFIEFPNKYLKVIKRLKNTKDLNKEFEVLLVGSEQV